MGSDLVLAILTGQKKLIAKKKTRKNQYVTNNRNKKKQFGNKST
jgi:hypothetical protein